jgi:hypothetical protein
MLNLLLDLDETLISSQESPIDNTKADLVISEINDDGTTTPVWYTYKRPYLDEFLDHVFSNYNVSVFTASQQSYCLDIVDGIILKNHPERKLDYIFFSDHCEQSEKLYDNNSKSLKMLWEVYDLPNYNIMNTVLMDDRQDLVDAQPDCNIVRVPVYDKKRAYADQDTFLLEMMHQDFTLKNVPYKPVCLINKV